jgi:hypothetical protein
VAKSPPTEAALLFLSGLISHERGVSVNLTGNHDPAARDIFQDRCHVLALRQGQQTTAFLGLSQTVFCVVHGDFFRVTLDDSCIQPLGEFFVYPAPDSKFKRDHSQNRKGQSLRDGMERGQHLSLGSGFRLIVAKSRLENRRFAVHIQGMGDADGGFIVLVEITVGDGLSPYRGVYLVGCSTDKEAKARIADFYPSEPNIKLYVSPLRIDDAKDLRLARNEVRPWNPQE